MVEYTGDFKFIPVGQQGTPAATEETTINIEKPAEEIFLDQYSVLTTDAYYLGKYIQDTLYKYFNYTWDSVQSTYDNVTDTGEDIINEVKNTVSATGSDIMDYVYDTFKDTVSAISGIESSITDKVESGINEIGESIGTVYRNLNDNIFSYMTDLKDFVNNIGSSISQNITDGLATIEPLFSTAFGQFRNNISDLINIIPSTLVKLLEDMFLEEVE